MSNSTATIRDWVYRGGMLTLVIAGLGFVFQASEQRARYEQKIDSHLAKHPDTGLTNRIDRQQIEIDMLRARVRALEIRLGAYEEEPL